MRVLDVLIPSAAAWIIYSTRNIWVHTFEKMGYGGCALLALVFAVVYYFLHKWIIDVTQPARSYVTKDSNGKYTCTNWGLNQSYQPAEIVAPKTLDGMLSFIL